MSELKSGNIDIEALFSEKFQQIRKEENAKYFLMRVDTVAFGKTNPDMFKVTGTRIDTGKPVAVVSKKSASGQHFPEAGSVMRADKVTRKSIKDGVSAYEAQYFHAYRKDSLCVNAVIQAPPPRHDTATNMVSAQIHAFDTEANARMLRADVLLGNFERELARLLKPWAAEKQSGITHDVKGDSLWSSAGAPGFSPFVAVRFAGQVFKVYGTGAVKEGDTFRLPTDAEILDRVQRNTHVQNIKAIAQEAPADQLRNLPITLIPGLSMMVGRDSLTAGDRKYLGIPAAFDWVNRDRLDEKGQPTIQPGFREGFVHIKQSRSGRMVVVDVAPSLTGRLMKSIPETAAERAFSAAKAQQAAPEVTSPQASAPAPQQAPAAPAPTPKAVAPVQAKPQQARPASPPPSFDEFDQQASKPNTASNAYDENFGDEAEEDFDMMATDMAAIEGLGNDLAFDDPDADKMFEEAAALQAARRNRPRM